MDTLNLMITFGLVAFSAALVVLVHLECNVLDNIGVDGEFHSASFDFNKQKYLVSIKLNNEEYAEVFLRRNSNLFKILRKEKKVKVIKSKSSITGYKCFSYSYIGILSLHLVVMGSIMVFINLVIF